MQSKAERNCDRPTDSNRKGLFPRWPIESHRVKDVDTDKTSDLGRFSCTARPFPFAFTLPFNSIVLSFILIAVRDVARGAPWKSPAVCQRVGQYH